MARLWVASTDQLERLSQFGTVPPDTNGEQPFFWHGPRLMQLLENCLHIFPASLRERAGPHQAFPFSARHFSELFIQFVIDIA